MDLLDKSGKHKPIKRAPVNEPTVTTTKDDIVNLNFDKKKPNIKVRKRPTIDEPSTNVRVGVSIKDKIDTLLVMKKFEIVNDLIDYLVDDYVSNELTKDERKTFDTILDIYKLKRQ